MKKPTSCAGLFLLACSYLLGAQPAFSTELRVCADPNNMPFSNRAGEGFENRLAALMAHDLDRELTFFWWPQRRGFVRNTVKAGVCDVIMGMPSGLQGLDSTTPYYRSGYVFVTRADRHLDIHSMTDPRLRSLKIGVHLIGDDGVNVPPAHALAEQGIVKNVSGYSIYGDYSEADPPAKLMEAVARGDIDVAAAWGPLAGWYAKSSAVRLVVTPIRGTEGFAPLVFDFGIAVGVRRGNAELQAELEKALTRRRAEIDGLLKTYGIPLLPPSKPDAPRPE
ncbi:MAG: quinoprotein dehydrogenase-associated putative ABC transporter substrate-binding protein [Mesorhizobium sp.]|uniref:substrate-binding domain-containing protein n=1 Tax=Mesorhizobium sp. TaxID=1871066 RepID=UPI000FE70916|nr:substrate-binding domain-containing protein [Mesorhizobium sp.]RWM85290.1 MAG: quinoprotein dehydrogenase-associated putative ABC transporter substrate-binding protein [Mesorhizobium sp.]